eukprot:TRINITY_DN67105_c1_g3_i1.p1 TRINITY_DN67105_c1_g3~~TRINITY_DN67105_c1_g3_i1.p1  ORF type:complete len:902 (-),score=386.03 TRINITY_DN67105_c1_g3_i1:524-3229(-)
MEAGEAEVLLYAEQSLLLVVWSVVLLFSLGLIGHARSRVAPAPPGSASDQSNSKKTKQPKRRRRRRPRYQSSQHGQGGATGGARHHGELHYATTVQQTSPDDKLVRTASNVSGGGRRPTSYWTRRKLSTLSDASNHSNSNNDALVSPRRRPDEQAVRGRAAVVQQRPPNLVLGQPSLSVVLHSTPSPTSPMRTTPFVPLQRAPSTASTQDSATVTPQQAHARSPHLSPVPQGVAVNTSAIATVSPTSRGNDKISRRPRRVPLLRSGSSSSSAGAEDGNRLRVSMSAHEIKSSSSNNNNNANNHTQHNKSSLMSHRRRRAATTPTSQHHGLVPSASSATVAAGTLGRVRNSNRRSKRRSKRASYHLPSSWHDAVLAAAAEKQKKQQQQEEQQQAQQEQLTGVVTTPTGTTGAPPTSTIATKDVLESINRGPLAVLKESPHSSSKDAIIEEESQEQEHDNQTSVTRRSSDRRRTRGSYVRRRPSPSASSKRRSADTAMVTTDDEEAKKAPEKSAASRSRGMSSSSPSHSATTGESQLHMVRHASTVEHGSLIQQRSPGPSPRRQGTNISSHRSSRSPRRHSQFSARHGHTARLSTHQGVSGGEASKSHGRSSEGDEDELDNHGYGSTMRMRPWTKSRLYQDVFACNAHVSVLTKWLCWIDAQTIPFLMYRSSTIVALLALLRLVDTYGHHGIYPPAALQFFHFVSMAVLVSMLKFHLYKTTTVVYAAHMRRPPVLLARATVAAQLATVSALFVSTLVLLIDDRALWLLVYQCVLATVFLLDAMLYIVTMLAAHSLVKDSALESYATVWANIVESSRNMLSIVLLLVVVVIRNIAELCDRGVDRATRYPLSEPAALHLVEAHVPFWATLVLVILTLHQFGELGHRRDDDHDSGGDDDGGEDYSE